MNIDNQDSIIPKFLSNFRWNIFGSISYEVLKILHQVFLLRVMEASNYGLFGSIFSIVYLTVYLSEFGLDTTLPPFLNIFTQSKQNFKQLFFKIYFLPQIGIILAAALIATYFYSKSFLNNQGSPYLLIIPLIIISESLRIFFRRFLHTVFLSKKLVIAETLTMTAYLCMVWIPYILFNTRMTLNLVCIPYFIDSFAGVIISIFLIRKYYKNLPNKELSYPANLWKRVIKMRFFNYCISAGKNLFTGNFLTPFFATQFGLRQAGVFNLANHLAESIKAIMKVTVIFSGNALLAKLKSTTLGIKKQAFKLLGDKLNRVIYPIIIFLVINFKPLLKLKQLTDIPESTLLVALIFLLMTFMEYFFLVYEQFYIVEEQSSKLFVFKLLEFSLFYGIVIYPNFSSLITTLLCIIGVRTLSFVIIATNAYAVWKIKPNFKIDYKYLATCIIISLLFLILFNLNIF